MQGRCRSICADGFVRKRELGFYGQIWKNGILPEGYNWRTYGAMNVAFWEKNQDVSEEEALRRLEESHHQVMRALETFSDEELFTKGFYPWVGGSSIGGYFISNTSSHYAWAIKKMKAHKKNCRH